MEAPHKEALPPGKDMHDNAWGCFVQGGPRDPGTAFPLSGLQPHHRLNDTNFYAKCVPNQLRATPSTNRSLTSFTNREQSPLSPSTLNYTIWSLLDNPELSRIHLFHGHYSDGLFVSQILCSSTAQNLVLRVEVTARWIAQHKEEFPKSQRYFNSSKG